MSASIDALRETVDLFQRNVRRPMLVIGLACILSTLLGVSSAAAYHYSQHGWVHEHKRYPARPSGLSAMNATFGNKCTAGRSDANNNVRWIGKLPNGDLVTYQPRYNKKLGGASTSGIHGAPKFPNSGSTVMEDVATHLIDAHQTWPDVTATSGVKAGIYGYLCRKISGSTKYSVHSWGVAIDINAAYENYPDSNCQPNSFGASVSNVWTGHGFYWGKNFSPAYCDPMHFQFVTNY